MCTLSQGKQNSITSRVEGQFSRRSLDNSRRELLEIYLCESLPYVMRVNRIALAKTISAGRILAPVFVAFFCFVVCLLDENVIDLLI